MDSTPSWPRLGNNERLETVSLYSVITMVHNTERSPIDFLAYPAMIHRPMAIDTGVTTPRIAFQSTQNPSPPYGNRKAVTRSPRAIRKNRDARPLFSSGPVHTGLTTQYKSVLSGENVSWSSSRSFLAFAADGMM